MAGTPVFVYTSDPGLEVLLGNGPVINVVRDLQQAVRFAGGAGILGVVGAVVNDQGRVNEPIRAPLGPEELFSTFGGFKDWMGDGLDDADRGAAGGYNGNLAAQAEDMIAPLWVFVFPDLAIKTITIGPTAVDLLISFVRTATDNFVLRAGTRVAVTGGGEQYTVATLEDVVWLEGDITSKTSRCRQVSRPVADGGPAAPANFDLVNAFVDVPPVAQVITTDTASQTTIDEIDLAEVQLRYELAFDLMTSELEGAAVTVVCSDRTESGIADKVSTHATAETGIGHFRVGVVAPPIGTSVADSEGVPGDGVGRATLDRTRTAYTHPGFRRPNLLDSDNLIGPKFLATYPSALLAACKIALEPPEQNPAIPHPLFARVGFTGLEKIVPAPVPTSHFKPGIMQPIIDNDQNGNQIGSFFAGIVANGAEIADVRFDDFIVREMIVRSKPWHKRAATEENQGNLVSSVSDFLETLLTAGRIQAYGLKLTYDSTNQHAELTVAVKTNGNMNTITFRTEISPATVVKQQTAA